MDKYCHTITQRLSSQRHNAESFCLSHAQHLQSLCETLLTTWFAIILYLTSTIWRRRKTIEDPPKKVLPQLVSRRQTSRSCLFLFFSWLRGSRGSCACSAGPEERPSEHRERQHKDQGRRRVFLYKFSGMLRFGLIYWVVFFLICL